MGEWQDDMVPECRVCGAVYGHDTDCASRARRQLAVALDKIKHLERALQGKE